MSHYLARLVHRASGAKEESYVTPAVRAAEVGSDARDPFEATAPANQDPAPSAPLVSHKTTPETLTASPLPQSRELPAPRAELQGGPPIKPRARAAFAPAQPMLTAQSAPAYQNQTSPSGDSPQEEREVSRVLEHRVVKSEVRRETLQPAPESITTDVQSTPAAELHRPSVEGALPQIKAPKPASVPPVQIPVWAARELRTPLEPARPQPEAMCSAAEATREEPRLVIGRMQVEVIPAAPATLPPRVSVTPRRRPAPADSASPSRLQFGLAQM